jgi:starch synthase (maltosyl-transferring)
MPRAASRPSQPSQDGAGAEALRRRVVIEGVSPEIDGGRYPAKTTLSERFRVEADVFADGHDVVCAQLKYRRERDTEWTELPMQPVGNDRWRAEFRVSELTRYMYTVEGWVDQFKTWSHDLAKRLEAGQDVSVDLAAGAELVEGARRLATGEDANRLRDFARSLRSRRDPVRRALSPELARLMGLYSDRSRKTVYDKELKALVERDRARFSTWYELFPRSTSPIPDNHGSFRDTEDWLPYIAEMGFDVLYLPPIHPIGRSFRKGKNNAIEAEAADPGSPWAIGAAEGGHMAVHPELGTLKDFRRLVKRAKEHGLEVALDIAFQCSPDHPYVREHPEWFRKRPDGSIQYAENPPKKYQDIYPFDFDTEQWQELWVELRNIVLFWVDHDVRIFRVDNPHTKPFQFWQWLIAEVRRDHPEVIFLSEAFTRPRVMEQLAKLGFSQSYTYFTWRNTAFELQQYLRELTQTDLRHYFRPNFWPNTPDILPEHLQSGGRPAFMARLVLAATLSSSYGIYGPAFELCVNRAVGPGKEEYLDSEKYELKHWDRRSTSSLREFITRVNRIRRENSALQHNRSLRFHTIENPQMLCYSKTSLDGSNLIVTVVSLDPWNTQTAFVDLPLDSLGIESSQPYQVHDLLTDARYMWWGQRNYVELHPHSVPAHIFRIRRHVRTERDFEYYA